MTVGQALNLVKTKLATSSDAPVLDAQWLLLDIFNQSETAWLYARLDTKLNHRQTISLLRHVRRRRQGEPLAYILGEWEFLGRRFHVNRHVLVPRPATEALVTKALAYLKDHPHKHKRPYHLVDIGTGSGCVIISLVLLLKQSANLPPGAYKFTAIDISPSALQVARRNARRHAVSDLITFHTGNMLAPLANQPVDLIVSNPPYLPSSDLATTKPTSSLAWEPTVALNGGPDGQQFINALKLIHFPAIIETTGGKIITTNLRQ